MKFIRFFEILIRCILLNAVLMLLCFLMSLFSDGSPFFFWNETDAGKFLVFMYVMVNLLHWIMEILLLFFKPTDYDEPF